MIAIGAPSGDAARAVFESRCLNCHGQAQTSGLDLRQIDTIAKGGKRRPAIVPGHADQSLLYKAVARSGDLQMPPGKPLPAAEIAIRAWIDGGASWDNAAAGEPAWWSFRKVMRLPVPAVAGGSTINPVDAFILSQLQRKGLKPVAAADKRRLIRRATYERRRSVPPLKPAPLGNYAGTYMKRAQHSFWLVPLACLWAFQASKPDYRDWKVYGGSPENIRYSKLDQINRDNVTRLQVAWTYDTGDAFPGSEMQCNPIVIDGVLYATTPKLRVIALDAATGKLLWSFDPNEGKKVVGKSRNRGLAYREGRIYVTARNFLFAVDARTGKLVPGFGNEGRVDLREGLGREPKDITIADTTPGVVYKDLLIMGSMMSESLPSPPGHIRAFDARTGKLRWIFHTIPHPGEFGYETWPKDAWTYSGAANNWAGMTVDEKRGLVFAPTGSAATDFYGANRAGDNLFANCLIALKADTGERVWHFQAVRHDLWDRDFPAPPNLVTVKRDGKLVDAVAQITKSGHVWVFERETGKPLFPIEYRKVSTDAVEGEAPADTQPLPLKPPAFSRQIFTEDMVTNRTEAAHKAVLERFKKIRSKGQFEPPSLEGTVVFPGFDGGGEWGGAAFDPDSGLLYVNANEMAWILRLVERGAAPEQASGRNLYLRNCASCHRDDLRGTPPEFPSLVRIGDKYTVQELGALMRSGSGRMPGFRTMSNLELRAVANYLTTGEDTAVKTTGPARRSVFEPKYQADGYNKFLDPEGYPAMEPPWGTLNAIDLNKGEIAWKIPLGEYPELAAKGMRNTGTENYGGPVVTAGGILFIGASNHDKKFHAFDKASGKLLWETTLPASGNATPATYAVNGRQFVVIAAGGGKSGAPSGGSYVAFALPEAKH